MPLCKSCHARIFFLRTPAGRNMPVDETRRPMLPGQGPDSGIHRETLEIVRGAFVPDGEIRTAAEVLNVWVPHWITCNDPDRFRRRRCN